MTTPDLSANRQEQKKRLLKAKIAVALHDELGRVPKTEEIDQAFTQGDRILIPCNDVDRRLESDLITGS
jgi:hypothetical protein